MTFSMTTFTAPSGEFVSTHSFCKGGVVPGSFLSVYNPAVLEKHRDSYETMETAQFGTDEWAEAIRKYSEPVSQKQFDAYAEKLIALASHIGDLNPDCSLGPLRGAAKPCVTVEVMSRGSYQYDYFNFQQGSENGNHSRIISDLTEILTRHDPGEDTYLINVTDTAKGGHGINTLVRLIAEVKQSRSDFSKQRWVLDLNLLHDTTANTNIGNIERVRNQQEEGRFDIQVNRYSVPSLIVEDFDPALAFSLEWDGQRHLFKPCSVDGQFLYCVGDEVRLVQSHNCYLTFEELYSQAITECLRNSPGHQQVGTIWQEYQQKG